MFKKKTDLEAIKMTRLKKIYAELISQGYFVPKWQESGGKNEDLLLDTQKPEKEQKFFLPLIDRMNWQQIKKQSKRSLKFPLARCIELLDVHMQKQQIPKKSGFASKPCSSKHFKAYLIDCDPESELALFECWSKYSKFDDGTKKLYKFTSHHNKPIVG